MSFQVTELLAPKWCEKAYLERIKSLEQMLHMTTSYMEEIEKEIREKNALLELYSRKFNESLTFSSLLQEAIMPSEREFKRVFKESFMIFRPKDIIGGDFLWMRERDGYIYVACIDCTGHGVPGAMLTMAAHFSLNASFEHTPTDDPALLISRFNTQFYNHFHLNQGEAEGLGHGLDIGMLIIHPDRTEVRYAGTHQSLICTNGMAVNVYRGNAGYVGNKVLKLDTSHRIRVEKGNKFFMFTDGISDQFGGPKNKKILSSRVRKMLERTHGSTIDRQKAFIETVLTKWQGDEDQTDDMLMVGFSLET